MKLNLYSMRLCKRDEYDKLIDFFRKYWNDKHVFCRNKQVFEFQHGTANEGEYDFVIAIHNETDEIHAVLGFISSSRYDGGDMENPIFIAGALWKVRDDVKNKEVTKLGLGVLYYLLKKFPNAAYITLGLSGFAKQIYTALHFEFGIMKHYYIANMNMESFDIAYKPAINKIMCENENYKVDFIESIPDEFDSYYYPTKNKEYIVNKYIKHPFYKYDLLGVYHNDKLCTIWIIRKIKIKDHICLRLVDIIGDMSEIENIQGNVHRLLSKYNAEYIDCYNYGIDENIFLNMGFVQVSEDTIIPNYFEPFEQKNVDIYCAALSKKPVVIFKGDADQERPNLLEYNKYN
ncbi:MAG: hypothetical protein E7252_03030 [Lachnospira sp.]|nr:hypothetical protein [Lachnospira sp.]